MSKRFKPEIGAFVKILFFLLEAVIILSLFFLSMVGQILMSVLFVLVAVFFMLLIRGSYYELRPDCLYVRYACFSYKFVYSAIVSVQKTTSPASEMTSLSLSRNAVELKLVSKEKRPKSVLISPSKQDEFVKELEKRLAL